MMNLARCETCGTLNVIGRDICKDCEAPLDHRVESSATGLGFAIRIYAAGWFALAALVPILFVFASMGGGFLVTFLPPVLLAGMFGFNIGAKILDPTVTKTARSAAINGAKVSSLALITYLSLLAFAYSYNTAYPSVASSIYLMAIIFIYGMLIVGWLVLIVGTAAGYVLYKVRFGGEFEKWITTAPRIKRSRARLMTAASVMVFVILSIVPNAITLRNLANERTQLDEMFKIRDMAEQGQTQKLRDVLSKDGIDPDFKEIPGYPIIVAAAGTGQEETVKLLLEHGADPNRTVPYTLSALTFAAGHNNVGLMRDLVDAGADINLMSGDEGITPLMNAAPGNNLEAVNFLLDRGALVNLRDQKGKTALTRALEQRKRNDGRNPDGTLQFPDVMSKCDETISLLRNHGATE